MLVCVGHSLRQAQGRLCPTLLGLGLRQGQRPTSKATDRSVRHTLAANINGKSNTNLNVKGVGQECPTHTCNCDTNSDGNPNSKVKCVGQGCPTHTSLPCCLLDPEPLVVCWSRHQSSSDWILPHVFQFFFEAFLRAHDVVEGFFLPDRAAGTAEFIHASGRRAFQQLQDYGQ